MDDLEDMRNEILTPSVELTKPGKDKVGCIQTDLFCEGCGFNLKGQSVWKDERLGIFVCRCAECGRHHAPGTSTSAGNLWLGRISRGLMLLWVMFLVGWFVYTVGAIAELQFNYLGIFTGEVPGINGRSTVFVQPAGTVALQQITEVLLYSIFLCSGLGAGISVFLWQLRRVWYFLALPIPAIIAIGVWIIWRTQVGEDELRIWGINSLALMSLMQCCAVGVGVILGRPLARRVLSLVFSGQMLYNLEFLWTVDDKVLPARGTLETDPNHKHKARV